jgi:hypothetical protein
MAKTLDDAIKQLQTVAGGLSSVKKASERAKEHELLDPFSVSYPEEGSIDSEEVPATKGLHTIITEIHFRTTVLELTLADAQPMIEEFAKAVLADPTLAGTCDTVVGPIRYKFGWLTWGGKKEDHVGPQFRTTVKIRATS